MRRFLHFAVAPVGMTDRRGRNDRKCVISDARLSSRLYGEISRFLHSAVVTARFAVALARRVGMTDGS